MNRGLRLLLLCAFWMVLLPALAAAQQVSLTILHTNDTHSHLLPFSYPSRVSPGSELAALRARSNIGGIARRATLYKRLRAELERKGTTVWLVDAGDFSDGTPFSTEYHGEADIEAMNAAGYAFGTIGNHELNNPLPRLKNLIGMFRFPLLCANLTENATGQLLVRASVIREVGPLRIAVFGLTTREGAHYPAAKGLLTIEGEMEAARRMAVALRREADIVIALSHAGEEMDGRIASAIPGIDVIVGGHSHSRLPFGERIPFSEDVNVKAPRGTIVVQAHQWGGELGRLDLQFSRDEGAGWRVSRYQARLIPVLSDIPDDPAVAAVVDRYWKPIASRYGVILGQAADDFVPQRDDLAHYNLVADAVRETYGTEIELENTGGVRAPLVKGKITQADLADMDPFENTVVTFEITGRQLKEVLLKTRPAVSGLRYRIDRGRLAEVTVGGKPVEDDRVYTGATNSYFLGFALKGIESVNTGKLRREVVAEYIRKKGTVRPLYDGRRVIIEPQIERKFQNDLRDRTRTP